MFRPFIAIVIILVPFSVYAVRSDVTIRGVMGFGTLDSAIVGLNNHCIFLTDSDVFRSVLSVCNEYDECEVTGNVDENHMLLSVSIVKKIDTSIEPSTNVITEAVCWSSSISGYFDKNTMVVESIGITNYQSKTVNNEIFWHIDYVLNISEKGKMGSRRLNASSMWLVRRENKWNYSHKLEN